MRGPRDGALPMFALALAVAAFAPMLVETHIAARHDRALRQQGAIEPRGDVYRTMQVAYPAAFIAMVLEAWLHGARADRVAAAGAALFSIAKALKYWAMTALGPRWTFRVLVPPRSTLVARGPYRLLRHPNYAAVIGEVAGFAVMSRSAVAGPLSVAGFALLIYKRIAVEERALGLRAE